MYKTKALGVGCTKGFCCFCALFPSRIEVTQLVKNPVFAALEATEWLV